MSLASEETCSTQKLEFELDSIISSKMQQRDRVVEMIYQCSTEEQAKYYQLLLEPKSETQVRVNASLRFLGPYLASRLLGTGFLLPFDNTGMYALADAVRSSSLIDIIRWYFVLNKYTRREATNTTLARLVEQTGVVMNTLLTISNFRDAEYETRFLSKLNAE
ncbi:hypothetical protein [Nitrosospira sp. Is2]|uniref:hypothetical protein n=1 Tax=Nitrosospira sp. Is2 TaxID=3080532 RepID=UPI00295393FB|nr:hypothetical protein [Nitrosospira sp. Is2]WON74463.1 hypothetical protein R5L00_02935 [Nitrosospira sp. Is2]